jgi:hypothetical protein
VASVPPCATIEERAKALRDQLIEAFEPGASLNLVAHSMGGLDCRYLISRLGFPSDHEIQIKSLTSICTPHRGSPFMDWFYGKFFMSIDRYYKVHCCVENVTTPETIEVITPLLKVGGFQNLTTDYCKNVFNPSTPDKPGVLYYSFGASPSEGVIRNSLSILKLTYPIVYAREGPNDGIVSVNSAKWGTYLGTLQTDHLDLRFVKNFYSQIADHLHEVGL